jgi:protein-disulfide isomerase
MNKQLLVVLVMITASAPATIAQQSAVSRGQRPSEGVEAKKTVAPRSSIANDTKEETCECEEKAPTDVLAVVNGVRITTRDIDQQIKDQITDFHLQVIEARKRELDLQINSKLLESEAKKRGISSAKLLDQEIVAKVKEPTEAEARTFYDQRKSQIRGEYKDVKGDLIDYLRSQRQGEEAKKLAAGLRAAADVKVAAESVTTEKGFDRTRVLATVNGNSIMAGDVEESVRTIIFAVQEQIYLLRKRELDLRINNVLLEQEAQSRKITTRALLETEVGSKLKAVTEDEGRAFYEQNNDKIKGDYSQVRPQIKQHLEKRREREAEIAFAEQLRRAATMQIFLSPPEQPVYSITTEDQPAKGRQEAPVTIVEFTDYQCPTCAKTHPIIEELVREYGEKVRLVVRDFPLEQHANAFKAAEAAEAAREQGKYWEYVTILFQKQSELDAGKLKEYASQLGLDRSKFDAAVDGGQFSDRVHRDLRDGMKLGINSTPTVFINGRRISEKTRESLKSAIDAALKGGASR